MRKKNVRTVVIITLVAIAIGAFFYVNNRSTSGIVKSPAALFTFKENLAVEWNTTIPIEIDVIENVTKLELFYSDSLFISWDNPKIGKFSIEFEASYYGLGARDLRLVSHLPDGDTYEDYRLVRVLSDIEPQQWTAEIVARYPHQTGSFTQGLEFNTGILYEGTGQLGQSLVAQVNLQTGQHIKKYGLDGSQFGEGITIFGDELFQLTYKTQRCFIYNKNTLEPTGKEFTYTGEGWGLCNDGKHLIMSNGTERLTFRDPKSFQTIRTIEVYTNEGPVTNLNELEYIDGLIYANVWMSNQIMVIHPENGKVLAQIDAKELVVQGRGNGEVLNGIALDHATGKIYMTGKNWPTLFEVKINKGNNLAQE